MGCRVSSCSPILSTTRKGLARLKAQKAKGFMVQGLKNQMVQQPKNPFACAKWPPDVFGPLRSGNYFHPTQRLQEERRAFGRNSKPGTASLSGFSTAQSQIDKLITLSLRKQCSNALLSWKSAAVFRPCFQAGCCQAGTRRRLYKRLHEQQSLETSGEPLDLGSG